MAKYWTKIGTHGDILLIKTDEFTPKVPKTTK